MNKVIVTQWWVGGGGGGCLGEGERVDGEICSISSHRYYCILRGIYSSPASIYDFQAHDSYVSWSD